MSAYDLLADVLAEGPFVGIEAHCKCPRPVTVGPPNEHDWCPCRRCGKPVALIEVVEENAFINITGSNH